MTMLGLAEPIPVPDGPVRMRVEVRGAALRFFYWKDGAWTRIGPVLDNSVLSDESGEGEQSKITGSFVGIGNFTGAFVGMAAHDVRGLAMPADFSHFIYKNLPQD